MLLLVISPKQPLRKKVIETFLADMSQVEVTHIDDSMMTLSDLEEYAYPSLFSVTIPVISTLFLLQEGKWESAVLPKLVASPTLFILQEMSMKVTDKKLFEKAGAKILLHDEGKELKEKKFSPVFNIASVICTAPDKKSRWLALTEGLQTESAEALIGIIYWKLRQLIASDAKKTSDYKKLYQAFMSAHSDAWQKGTVLALGMEKVILQK